MYIRTCIFIIPKKLTVTFKTSIYDVRWICVPKHQAIILLHVIFVNKICFIVEKVSVKKMCN